MLDHIQRLDANGGRMLKGMLGQKNEDNEIFVCRKCKVWVNSVVFEANRNKSDLTLFALDLRENFEKQ